MILNGLKRPVTSLHIDASAEKTGNDSFLGLMSACVCVMREENVFPVKSRGKKPTHTHM